MGITPPAKKITDSTTQPTVEETVGENDNVDGDDGVISTAKETANTGTSEPKQKETSTTKKQKETPSEKSSETLMSKKSDVSEQKKSAENDQAGDVPEADANLDANRSVQKEQKMSAGLANEDKEPEKSNKVPVQVASPIRSPKGKKKRASSRGPSTSESSPKRTCTNTPSERESSPKRKCRIVGECGRCVLISTSLPSYCATGARLHGQKCNKCNKEITHEFMKKVKEIYFCNKVGNKKPGEPRCTYIRCKLCMDIFKTPNATTEKEVGGRSLRGNPKQTDLFKY